MHSSRKTETRHWRAILSDAGYCPIITHRTRSQLIVLLTIAVNQIAYATRRPCWRVYQLIRDRAVYMRFGARFIPWNSSSLRAWLRGEGESSEERALEPDGDVVIDKEPDRCPCCGRPLEPLDPDDPRESPQSGEVEAD